MAFQILTRKEDLNDNKAVQPSAEPMQDNGYTEEGTATPEKINSPAVTERSATKIPIDKSMADAISAQFTPVLQQIIDRSNPSDEESLSESYKTVLPAWRKTIKSNLDKLAQTQSNNNGSDNVFSTKTSGIDERERSISELQHIHVRKTTPKGQRKEARQIIKYITELLENGTGDVDPQSWDDNGPYGPYKKYFKSQDQKKSKEELKGAMEGPVSRPAKANAENIDPYKDFHTIINKGEYNEKVIYFNFTGVDSIDDIIPLFAPKAQDSVIDAAKNDNDTENPYRKLYDVDTDIPEKGFVLNQYLGANTVPAAETDSKDKLEKYLFTKMNPNQRARILNAYRQKRFDEVLANINQSDDEKKTMEDKKKKWQDDQDKKKKEDLNTRYAAVFDLHPDETYWTDEKLKAIGYDTDGNVTQKAITDFIAWMQLYPPPHVKYAGDKFITDLEAPSFGAQDKDYTEASEKAEKLNDIKEGKKKITAWEIDAMKQESLTNLSLTAINPQKWDTGATEFGDRDEERKKGGQVKEPSPFESEVNKLPGDDNTVQNQAITYSTLQSGTIDMTEPKRDPKYDETSGYKKNPADKNSLAGFNNENTELNDMEKTNLTIESGEKIDERFYVNEKINWLIRYKVDAFDSK